MAASVAEMKEQLAKYFGLAGKAMKQAKAEEPFPKKGAQKTAAAGDTFKWTVDGTPRISAQFCCAPRNSL